MWWKIGIVVLLFLVAAFTLGWIIAMKFSEVRTAYEKRYGYLEMVVRYSTVDLVTYRHIKDLFWEIRQDFEDVLNEEQLEVLENDFLRKFQNVNQKP